MADLTCNNCIFCNPTTVDIECSKELTLKVDIAPTCNSYEPREVALPPVVTLCGSVRFKEQYIEMAKQLSLRGIAVFTVGFFPETGDERPDEATKSGLDWLHLQKIDMSDCVVIIESSYIGESTKAEIEYATESSKPTVPSYGINSDYNSIASYIHLVTNSNRRLKAKAIS